MTIFPHVSEQETFHFLQNLEINIMPMMNYDYFMVFLAVMAVFVIGMSLIGCRLDNGHWGVRRLWHKVTEKAWWSSGL
ncbi:MAG: hypothetical protein COB49_11115 [Alphaproteobacteria bacterium]|nr:MAG: hypothetical protein COB49_11115 [Alphaproteobacteria bacterium]